MSAHLNASPKNTSWVNAMHIFFSSKLVQQAVCFKNIFDIILLP